MTGRRWFYLFLLALVGCMIGLTIGGAAQAQAAPPSPAPVYGWAWGESVEVYDATGGGPSQVAEAVREFDRSDVVISMTRDQAAADIVVKADPTPCGSGCAYFSGMTVTAGVADGVCVVAIADFLIMSPMAEDLTLHELGHCLGLAHSTDPASLMYPHGDGSFTRPTRDVYRALNGLY